jgi:hypothetical protein
MILKDIWHLCEKELFQFPSTDTMFNLYSEIDRKVDLPDGAEIRKNNLLNYLKSFTVKPGILVVAEAPGPWGTRFSGVPLTSEKQLANKELPFPGRISSRNHPLIKTRILPPYWSNTSNKFWGVMLPFYQSFFAWNCVPLHPHEANLILSIRNPKRDEVKYYSQFLQKIIDILKPKTILAIGKKAELSLEFIKIHNSYIPHPSRLFNEFKTKIMNIFKPNDILDQDKHIDKLPQINRILQFDNIPIKKIDINEKEILNSIEYIEPALGKAKFWLQDQAEADHIIAIWKENRAALIALLMASKHAGRNIKNDYYVEVGKLTGKSCKPMPHFIGKLRKTPFVDGDLNWLGTIFYGADKLAELLFNKRTILK